MSEPTLTTIDRIRLQQEIEIGDADERTVNRINNNSASSTPKPKFAIKISNQGLEDIHTLRELDRNISAVDVISANSCINIKSERLEDRINLVIRKHRADWKQKRLRWGAKQREQYLNTYRKIHVFEDEIEITQELKSEWKQKVENVQDQLENVQDQLKKEQKKAEQLFNLLGRCNCGGNCEFLNSGNKIDNVEERQRRRKCEDFKNKSKAALWFADSYGVKLKSLKCETLEGTDIHIDFENKSTKYEDLPCDEKDKVKELVFILEKLGISDATYQSIHHLFPHDTPSKAIIVQCRNSFTETFIRTQSGVRVPCIRKEIESMIKHAIEIKSFDLDDHQPFRLKLGGDGTRVSRISTFVSFYLSHIDNSEVKQDSMQHRIIGLSKCSESYENIQGSFSSMFHEVNELLESPHLSVDGHDVELDFYLTGDMKMLNLLMGMKSCGADQSCIWCHIKSSERHTIPTHIEQYNTLPLCRNIQNMLHGKKGQSGMKNKPLLLFPVKKVIPDILHMLLRITDVLERNIIDEALEMDQKAKLSKSNQHHLSDIKRAFQSAGVPFEVWTSSDSRTSRDYAWTSLTGTQKVKILKSLPPKLSTLLHTETSNTVANIWRKFSIMYDELNAENTDDKELFSQAKEWMRLFLSLAGKRKGYAKKNITPYIHVLLAHAPYFVQEYGTLKKFKGQALEKCMDDVKTIFRKKTNKTDAAMETIVVRKRIEILHAHKAESSSSNKRSYEKRDTEFWEGGGKAELAAAKRRKIAEASAVAEV